jgi:hypothetical protein
MFSVEFTFPNGRRPVSSAAWIDRSCPPETCDRSINGIEAQVGEERPSGDVCGGHLMTMLGAASVALREYLGRDGGCMW